MINKILTITALLSCCISGVSANFALKRQLDGTYEEAIERIKTTRNPALCIDSLEEYLAVYQKISTSELDSNRTERHENLTKLLDKYAEELAKKSLTTSDSGRSVQAIELSQFLQKMKPAKLEIYEERIVKLRKIASSGSAKLLIDAKLSKRREELAKAVIDLRKYKELVSLINENSSILSPNQKETIDQFSVQLLKHFESYALNAKDKPLRFDQAELSLRYTACEIFAKVKGNSVDYKTLAPKLGKEIALEIDQLALAADRLFTEKVMLLKNKDKLDFDNLPRATNATVRKLREEQKIIHRIGEIVNSSKGLNYTVVKYLKKSTHTITERQDLAPTIQVWEYLELVESQNASAFAKAYDNIAKEYLKRNIGRERELIACGIGAIRARFDEFPAYEHNERADYLRSLAPLFNSLAFNASYRELLKEALTSQMKAVDSLRDLRESFEQFAFIDRKDPSLADPFTDDFEKLILGLRNGKAIKEHYTEHGFYKVTSEMLELRSFALASKPNFKNAFEQSFDQGFVESGIPEVKLCQNIEKSLTDLDFDSSYHKEIQDAALKAYKESYNKLNYVEQRESSSPSEAKKYFSRELDHIKNALPEMRKNLGDFMVKENLFEKVLLAVHRRKMDLAALKDVNELLDEHSIVDLVLPFESALYLNYYIRVLSEPVSAKDLFAIYQDTTDKPFGASLLPLAIGYP